MASKRKYKDSKQDTPFELPEFNEKEYLEEQLKIGRGVFVSIIWAVIIAIFTFFVFTMFQDQWTYIFIPGLFGLLSLYLVLPKMKVPLSEIKMKSWLNFVFAFGLTWLAVVIISLNPPFSDFADPIIDKENYQTLSRQEYNSTEPAVQVRAWIVDNYKLGNCEVTLTYPTEIGNDPQTERMTKERDNLYTYYLPKNIVDSIILNQKNMQQPLSIEYTIVARDSRDNEKEISGSFIIIEENKVPIFLKQEGIENPALKADKGRIELYLFDNSEFKEIYFTVNRYNEDIVDDNERYAFKLPEGFDPDDADEIRYDYHGSVRDFKKGSYNITITAVDAGNNIITMDWEFTMEKNGADYGKDENGGMLPIFGPFELMGAVVIGIAIILAKERTSTESRSFDNVRGVAARRDRYRRIVWKRKGKRSDR